MKLFIVLSQKNSLCWSSVYARMIVLKQVIVCCGLVFK